jgi:hypothetical protein
MVGRTPDGELAPSLIEGFETALLDEFLYRSEGGKQQGSGEEQCADSQGGGPEAGQQPGESHGTGRHQHEVSAQLGEDEESHHPLGDGEERGTPLHALRTAQQQESREDRHGVLEIQARPQRQGGPEGGEQRRVTSRAGPRQVAGQGMCEQHPEPADHGVGKHRSQGNVTDDGVDQRIPDVVADGAVKVFRIRSLPGPEGRELEAELRVTLIIEREESEGRSVLHQDGDSRANAYRGQEDPHQRSGLRIRSAHPEPESGRQRHRSEDGKSHREVSGKQGEREREAGTERGVAGDGHGTPGIAAESPASHRIALTRASARSICTSSGE